jgi:hypothetical protein
MATTAFGEFRRACAVHRQWLQTWRQSRDPRHLETVVALKRIAEEYMAG